MLVGGQMQVHLAYLNWKADAGERMYAGGRVYARGKSYLQGRAYFNEA